MTDDNNPLVKYNSFLLRDLHKYNLLRDLHKYNNLRFRFNCVFYQN